MNVFVVGGGTLFVLDVAPDGLKPVQVFEFNDGLFDLTWAENNENVLVAAGADGSIQVWDVLQPQVQKPHFITLYRTSCRCYHYTPKI